MKKIEAIVQPFKFNDVKEALQQIGIDGSTMQFRPSRRRRGPATSGMARVFVLDVQTAVRIRNGEWGEMAL